MTEDQRMELARIICPMLPDVSPSDCVQGHEYGDRYPCTAANCFSMRIVERVEEFLSPTPDNGEKG
jgi:hypothetical protein